MKKKEAIPFQSRLKFVLDIDYILARHFPGHKAGGAAFIGTSGRANLPRITMEVIEKLDKLEVLYALTCSPVEDMLRAVAERRGLLETPTGRFLLKELHKRMD